MNEDILELIEERARRKFEQMKKGYIKEKVGSNEKYKSGHLSRPVI